MPIRRHRWGVIISIADIRTLPRFTGGPPAGNSKSDARKESLGACGGYTTVAEDGNVVILVV